MKINELMQKRAETWNAAKNFVELHTNEKGLMSEEDRATYDKMEKDIHDYTKEIERMQRQEAMDMELSKGTTEPIVERPQKAVEDDESKKPFRARNEYKDAMIQALRSNFRQISNVLQEGVDADGGYLVPEELDRKLVEKLEEENIFRKLADKIQTHGERKINIADTTPAASWIEEGGAIQFSDATFSQIVLDAHKLHVAIKVTEELLYDNVFNLQEYIIKKFAQALSNAEEDAFLNGNGTGRPTGIFNATGGGQVSVTLEDATIKADDITTLIYNLKRPYRKNAKFIMNDQTISAIRKLKDNNGAFMWQPSIQLGEPDKIMGYPVYTSQFCPKMEAGKSFMAFGDFSYYKIGDRGTRSFAELKELFAGNGMVGFLAKERVDGKLVLPEAVQIMKVEAEDPEPSGNNGGDDGDGEES